MLTEKFYTDNEYTDILNDIYGTVEVCGMTFNAGYVLKELDPTAFNCGNNDYFDSNPRYECETHGGEYSNEDDECEECTQEETAKTI